MTAAAEEAGFEPGLLAPGTFLLTAQPPVSRQSAMIETTE